MIDSTSSNSNLERLYPIKSIGPYKFNPGTNAQGEQILMGEESDDQMVAIFFDSAGKYLRCEFRPMDGKPDPKLDTWVLTQQVEIYERTRATFAEELGLIDGDIAVRHFSFPDWDIGIAEWQGSLFDEILCVGRLPDGSIRDEDDFSDEVLEWYRERMWVLHWKAEFWMTATGEIEST